MLLPQTMPEALAPTLRAEPCWGPGRCSCKGQRLWRFWKGPFHPVFWLEGKGLEVGGGGRSFVAGPSGRLPGWRFGRPPAAVGHQRKMADALGLDYSYAGRYGRPPNEVFWRKEARLYPHLSAPALFAMRSGCEPLVSVRGLALDGSGPSLSLGFCRTEDHINNARRVNSL